MDAKTETRSCTQCSRPFDVPLTGYGRNRRKCLICAPKTVLAPVAAPSVTPEPVYTSEIEGNAFPEQSVTPPEYKGEFQTEAESILAEYPTADRAKKVAALAIAKALDSHDISGAQIGGLVTKWLAIMEQIKTETPAEPDEVDDITETVASRISIR